MVNVEPVMPQRRNPLRKMFNKFGATEETKQGLDNGRRSFPFDSDKYGALKRLLPLIAQGFQVFNFFPECIAGRRDRVTYSIARHSSTFRCDPVSVVEKMNEGLKSGKVENGKNLRVYLKEELPSRLHYAASDRITPIVGLVDEGFKVEQKRTKGRECGGAHGYENAFFSMRTIFVGHGPQFERGRKVPSFENVHIYNLVTTILNIQGAPNNGSVSFPKSVLLPAA
ncbi:hypothetical protein ACFX2C_017962 [Malus domestica]